MPIFGAGWIARKTGEAQQGWYGSVARRSRVSSRAENLGEKSGENSGRCSKLNIGGETGVINFGQRREPPSRRSDGPGSPSAELGSFCPDTREGRSGHANERVRQMRRLTAAWTLDISNLDGTIRPGGSWSFSNRRSISESQATDRSTFYPNARRKVSSGLRCPRTEAVLLEEDRG
jgi:hypothetical protein